MDEDLNLDLDVIESNTEERLKVKNRFQQLSEKVILTSKERDELASANQALVGDKESLSKERDFYKDFSVNVSKYPNASEYQEQILEKVRAGYTTEDAMVAVLAKEGKLTMPTEAPIVHSAEGGSAPTIMEGSKGLNDMKPEDKLSALAELDKTGDLANALRGR